MRAFYLLFPIWNALRTELSWTLSYLFASKYKLVLPSEDELRAELDRERAMFQQSIRE